MLKIAPVITILFIFTHNSAVFSMPPHPDLLKKKRETGQLVRLAEGMRAMKACGYNMPVRSCPATGTVNILVILIGFSDVPIGTTPAFFEGLFNANGSNLTWNRYYRDMSNNKLNLVFTIVAAPSPASGTHDYYGTDSGGEGNDAHPEELVSEAVALADPLVDYAQFDNDKDGYADGVVIIHAGRGQESGGPANDIWSHRSSIPSVLLDGVWVSGYTVQPEYVFAPGDTTIGVFVHEFGHLLGLHDLYDTTYKTDGVGMWSAMASGAWGGADGDRPTPLLAWERERLGWVSLGSAISETPLYPNHAPAAAAYLSAALLAGALLAAGFLGKKGHGRFAPLLALPLALCAAALPMNCAGCGDSEMSLRDLETSYRAVRVPLNSLRGQYLILENKAVKTGTFTEALPGSGLLITHIDDRFNDIAGPCNGINNLRDSRGLLHGVAVEEADGNYSLWDPDDSDSGSPGDLFGVEHDSFTPHTRPDTGFYHWSHRGLLCISGFSIDPPVRSGIYILNISRPGETMTFTVERRQE